MSGQSHERGEHERHCVAAEAEIARFVELAGGADPATPVPTCPGWTIAGLARHHGTTHRWVEHIVRNRVRERLWSRDLPIEPPEDDADCAAWVADGAERLIATLRAAGPDDTAWTWVPDGHARFWSRRMAYEALVHRADVEIWAASPARTDPGTLRDRKATRSPRVNIGAAEKQGPAGNESEDHDGAVNKRSVGAFRSSSMRAMKLKVPTASTRPPSPAIISRLS
jgi:uncharacterized protein (TIGR03083 family)